MDTEEIMELSLKLAGLKEVPEDSAIYVSGDNRLTAESEKAPKCKKWFPL